MEIRPDASGDVTTPNWNAIWSMALGVFSLVMAEMLPVSLLTPMARTLGVSEGLAGQAVTATAVIGFLTCLLTTTLARDLDRRRLLLAFSVLLIMSNLIVAVAPGLPLLLLGRLLLGVALGGFWTMASATAMRLVPASAVPRALSIVFGGISAATVVTGPLGSFLGHMLGWRAVYLAGAGVGLVTLCWQFVALPTLPARGQADLGTLWRVLRRPQIIPGMIAVVLVFTGHFAVFTYLRPFLEIVTGVDLSMLSVILLAFGMASVLGTMAVGGMLNHGLRFALAIVPVSLAAIGLALAIWGGVIWSDTVLIALWGFASGALPVAWTTWVTRTVPDEAESASGLLVAGIQFSIAVGAGAGGAVFDLAGIRVVLLVSAALLTLAVVVIATRLRESPGALA